MRPQGNEWERYSVVLVTLDSCRFDSAALAATPNLDRLGPLRRAITPGTFTLPAHMAFFSGYLPNVVELPLIDYYSRERFQLWRLSRAKQKPQDSYAMILQGDTITEGFRNRGFDVIGAGGTRWFLTDTLRGLFDDCSFWGPRDYSDWFALRKPEDFALNHQDELLAKLHPGKRWFLFVNSLETHAPSTTATTRPARPSSASSSAPSRSGRVASFAASRRSSVPPTTPSCTAPRCARSRWSMPASVACSRGCRSPSSRWSAATTASASANAGNGGTASPTAS